MEMKLQFKLSQQLVMTPQLVQAIRLLQLSRMELVDEVRKELDGNPVLADDATDPRARDNADKSMPTPTSHEAPPEERVGMTERVEAETDMASRQVEKLVKEVDWEQFLENRQLQQPLTGSRGGFDELPPIEQSLTKPQSLREHLLWQLQMSDFVDNEKQFALLVIGNLDERGYLDLAGGEDADGNKLPDLTIEDLAREAELDPEDAPDVLAMIQRFDPIGVAARDLSECLRVQAEVLGFDQIEMAIINEHLHNVERRNFQAIAKALKVPLEEIYEAVQEIQKLESVHALTFAEVDDMQIAITPDLYVIMDGG
jgi:RNA polymerase sigma-54 factor